MATKRPSTVWQLSPVEQRWILVRFVVVLSDCLQQFGVYNVFKDDGYGLDLIQDGQNGFNAQVFAKTYLHSERFVLLLQ